MVSFRKSVLISETKEYVAPHTAPQSSSVLVVDYVVSSGHG